jgi:hypothetical protein
MAGKLSIKEYRKLCGEWHTCTCLDGKRIKVAPFTERKNMRHGLSTTINELKQITDELIEEIEKTDVLPAAHKYPDIHFELPIVNKDGTSDGWTFERKGKKVKKNGKTS